MMISEVIHPDISRRVGLLPIIDKPVKFAVGDLKGLSSNSWRIWDSKNGDIYIMCRDGLNEAKVSLHASNRWRMAFTQEAFSKNLALCFERENRVWEVWDKPEESLPNTVTAFKLYFPLKELGLDPSLRKSTKWKDVFFIEASPSPLMTVITLFVCSSEINLKHSSQPSFCLAKFHIKNNHTVQVIAHSEKEGNIPKMISNQMPIILQQLKDKKIDTPISSFCYLFGHHDDGCRYIVGAKADRFIRN